jgi:FKBP-type peptidyl-prolyl cis-trans isomerase FklB
MNYFSSSLLIAGLVATATVMAAEPATQPAAAPVSTNSAAALDPRFKDLAEQHSYALGIVIASDMQRNLQRGGYEVNSEILARSFSEFLTGKPTVITTNEAQAIFKAYNSELRVAAEAKRKVELEKNKKAGEEFLAANKTKEGVITLPSGLQYKILKAGTGPVPKLTDMVTTQYKGTLIDGTEFDSSYSRGEPATFGVRGVVKGWTEALQLMPVGSKWQLYIPSALAYGERGSPPKIGPNQTLVFDLELVGIKEPATPPPSPSQPGVTSDIIKVPSKAELDKGAKIEVIKQEELDRLQKEEAAKKAAEGKK